MMRASIFSLLIASLCIGGCAPKSSAPVRVLACVLTRNESHSMWLLQVRFQSASRYSIRKFFFDAYDEDHPGGSAGFEINAPLRPDRMAEYTILTYFSTNDRSVFSHPGDRVQCIINKVFFEDGRLWTPAPHLMPP
jgi:hypothetical protein